MKKLCEALKVNTGLTELELESQDHLCVGSRVGQRMKQLYLITGCGFGLEGARALSEALKGKTNITKLYLWGLTDKGTIGLVT